MVPKLAVVLSAAAPSRQHLSIRTKLHHSRATLIHDIDGIIRANGDAARTVEPRVWTLPLVDDSAVACHLLYAVLGSVRHVDIAGAIDGNAVRCAYLSIADSFDSHGAEEGPGRRELLDSPVAGIGYEDVSHTVDRDASWAVELSPSSSMAPLKRCDGCL